MTRPWKKLRHKTRVSFTDRQRAIPWGVIKLKFNLIRTIFHETYHCSSVKQLYSVNRCLEIINSLSLSNPKELPSCYTNHSMNTQEQVKGKSLYISPHWWLKNYNSEEKKTQTKNLMATKYAHSGNLNPPRLLYTKHPWHGCRCAISISEIEEL